MTSHRDGGASVSPAEAALLAALPVPAFLIAGPPGASVLTAANVALSALTGLAPEALLGRSLDTLLARQEEAGALHGLQAALAEGTAFAGELLFEAEGGAGYWGELHLAPLPAGGHVGQIVDVTRRKDAEGALALSRQREALGLLTNSVAHEFNNFLQILIGYIDGLNRRLGDRQEPFVRRALTRSTEASERAAALTRQLLAHSRRIAPDVRPIDLNAVVAAFVERHSPRMPERLSLTAETVPNLPMALANPIQVGLALDLLLANACEAISGAGRISIGTFLVPPGDRSLQRPENGAVGIAVTDTGHGLSPEMLTRALAPFATSREAGRGTGLAIVHGLMKRQSGTITLDSRPNEGATIRLVFPAAG
ncbi:ATP-binding protein [Methylobacterium organophilum]|uniref:histidine kinase n=1 Tax=Methylobacterium organophilum TaxID=410 RepID=A0ABQ4T7Y8_METOR|nr:ATP-binding protein [Methylobacterium organophilum]GJE27738.1 Blue-light-activated protein [Methylobacterium organophilum]